MKRVRLWGMYIFIALCLLPAACGQRSSPDARAENLFKLHCQSCHPDGKNVINPAKTLYGADLKKNNIAAPEDIVRVIRAAPRGMTSFDEKTLSDNDARMLARYVLATFR